MMSSDAAGGPTTPPGRCRRRSPRCSASSARLPRRAPAAGRLAGDDAATGAPRRAGRALAGAGHQRAGPPRPHPAAGRRPRPGRLGHADVGAPGHPRRAPSGGSATGSTSCSRATSRASRPRSPRSSTTSVRSTSTGSPCCAPGSSPSTTCSRRCSRWSAGWSGWPSSSSCSPRSTRPCSSCSRPRCRCCSWRCGGRRSRSAPRSRSPSDGRLGRHVFAVATTTPLRARRSG